MFVNPVSVGDFATEIRAHLLEGWRATAGDPDWLTVDGVPAGLRRHPEDCGIFPRTHVFGTCADDLFVDPREFQGYASVEADHDGCVEVQRLVERGWFKQFESYSELRAFSGRRLGHQQLWHVTKVKGDKVKKQLILDAKASGISPAASKRERVILPDFWTLPETHWKCLPGVERLNFVC